MSTMQMLKSSFLCVSFLYTVVVSAQFARFSKLELPLGVKGPESAAFGNIVFSEGPFTTVNDGRILKWQGPNVGFVDFAYTTRTRSKQLCDGTNDPNLGSICGRPLALSFNPTLGLLYIADAYFGLLVVGPNGGLATQLVGGLKFTVGVDVDLLTSIVYFSDASLTYNLSDITKPGFKPDSTGRFLRYNPFTGRSTVLLNGLSGGGGPAVSSDSTFVLVPELTANRISKYWLVGLKANRVELLLNNIPNPNKIKRASGFGEFWVALSAGFIPPTQLITPQGMRFNSNGVVLQTVSFATQFFNKTVSLVQEHNGNLYVGSRLSSFIGVYSN